MFELHKPIPEEEENNAITMKVQLNDLGREYLNSQREKIEGMRRKGMIA